MVVNINLRKVSSYVQNSKGKLGVELPLVWSCYLSQVCADGPRDCHEGEQRPVVWRSENEVLCICLYSLAPHLPVYPITLTEFLQCYYQNYTTSEKLFIGAFALQPPDLILACFSSSHECLGILRLLFSHPSEVTPKLCFFCGRRPRMRLLIPEF